MSPTTSAAMTYSRYLKIDELLSCQQPLSEGPEHDEMLFIIIHQVYELWFRQILHECDYLQEALHAADTPTSLHTLKRILTIMKTLVSQVDILETMTPLSFNSFRPRLESASGFQSAQFREVEFIMGHRRQSMVEHHPDGSDARLRLERRLIQPTLYQSLLRYLAQCGQPIPDEFIENPAPDAPEESPVLQNLLLEIYRGDPTLSQVCERLIDLDEGFQEWRYRHVKMVERTIGAKIGTGGSAGTDYLKATLFRPFFPDLWAIRSRM